MKAVKIFSNNAVSAIVNHKEAVLIGAGIGFHKHQGDEIDPKKIEKTYYIQDNLQTRFLQLLDEARPEALEISEDILKYALKKGLKLKNQLILSLIDHISFAIERYEQGILLPYLMLSETKLLYPKEFEIGVWSIEEIKQRYQIALPEYEAGYIALQLASSSMDRNATYNTLKMVKGTIDIIQQTFNLTLDSEDIDTLRLTTHLKFLAQRIFTHAQWDDSEMDDAYNMFASLHDKNDECINRICEYISSTFNYTLNTQEKVYLLVHLNKILHQGK